MLGHYTCMDTILVLIFHLYHTPVFGTLWGEWWTYRGISGPDFWGDHNPEWSMCRKGKLQSPINIDPNSLIYDQNLQKLGLSTEKIDGKLINTGQDITLKVDDSRFTFRGGPLSYTYTVHQIKFHLGAKNEIGSEHTVGGKAFPLEIQIFGYNGELYTNATEALFSPHGLAAIAVLTMIGDEGNDHFGSLIDKVKLIPQKGMKKDIAGFSISEILPTTDYFITYEGSTTQPGCYETVTWIVLNKPLHITEPQLTIIRALTIGDRPDLLMENNYRPTQHLNGRLVRTNIQSNTKDEECSTRKITFYEAVL